MDNELFLFGASTSSHQVEGGNHNNWTEWEKKRGKGEDYISGRACDHYNRFREDFDIAKSLSHNAHRFSIEWSRIEPQKGRFNEKEIEHYREVLHALRERGIEPLFTIWHWTLPIWLSDEGGILAKDFPNYFSRYAEKLALAFKKEVKFWITVNEPEVVSWNSYAKGVWPPQGHSMFISHRARANLIKAHRETYRKLKNIDPSFRVGAAMNFQWFESAGGIVNDVMKWVVDRLGNFYFLDRIRTSADFIGCNYYFHNRLDYGFIKNKNEETSDMGWEIYPEGIYRVLMDLKKYHLPIYITENGLADARDVHRESFIARHISWMQKAIDEGVDVRGYLHWSLLDNFEWDKGFSPRFGLVEIDYQTLERRIRPSAFVYKKIIETWHAG
jgi:beta-glucosidase